MPSAKGCGLMAKGWFKVQRAMLDHPLLQDGERFRAWCWLLSEAAHKPIRKDIKGKIIELDRGQVAHSVRFLATAWGWSKGAVERFLTRLKTETMIETATGTGQLIITICNYCRYQDDDRQAGTATGTATGTGAGQERDKLEEGKNVRRKERTPSPVSNAQSLTDRDTPTSTVDQTEFDQFWNEVPRKVGKGQARKAYKSARKKASGLELLAGIRAYGKKCSGKDPQYVCHPATWLNGERWLDEEASKPDIARKKQAEQQAREERWEAMTRQGGELAKQAAEEHEQWQQERMAFLRKRKAEREARHDA